MILVSLGVSHQETRSDLRGYVETSVSDYENVYMNTVVMIRFLVYSGSVFCM